MTETAVRAAALGWKLRVTLVDWLTETAVPAAWKLRVTLADWLTETAVRAAALGWKLRVTLAASSSHSILTLNLQWGPE